MWVGAFFVGFFLSRDCIRFEFDVFPASSYKSFMNKCVENGLCYQGKSAWVATSVLSKGNCVKGAILSSECCVQGGEEKNLGGCVQAQGPKFNTAK